MTSSFIGTWRSEANPRAFLRLEEDGSVTGSDGINRIITGWDEGFGLGSASAAHAPEADGPLASIRPAATTLMAAPNMQTWVTAAQFVSASGDELTIYGHNGETTGVLIRDTAANGA